MPSSIGGVLNSCRCGRLKLLEGRSRASTPACLVMPTVYERGGLFRMARVLGRRTPNASIFAKPIEAKRSLIVPTLALFEVFKRVSQQRNEDDALRAVAVMEQGRVVDSIARLAWAARLSIQHAIAMADSMMLATAHRHRATLWTQDSDFDGLPGARYYAKR